jgi:hypothetical protein
VPKSSRKRLNRFMFLGVLCIWLHRNKVVFNGDFPSMRSIQRNFLDESVCWVIAGAKGQGPWIHDLARSLNVAGSLDI